MWRGWIQHFPQCFDAASLRFSTFCCVAEFLIKSPKNTQLKQWTCSLCFAQESPVKNEFSDAFGHQKICWKSEASRCGAFGLFHLFMAPHSCSLIWQWMFDALMIGHVHVCNVKTAIWSANRHHNKWKGQNDDQPVKNSTPHSGAHSDRSGIASC